MDNNAFQSAAFHLQGRLVDVEMINGKTYVNVKLSEYAPQIIDAQGKEIYLGHLNIMSITPKEV